MWQRWSTPALTAAVAVIGLLASALAALVVEREQDRNAEASLDRRAGLVQGAVAAEIQRYEDTMRDIAASVGAQTDLTAVDFAGITSALSRERLFGATGISLVVPAQPDQVAEVQAFWRGRGSAGLNLRPAGQRYAPHRFAVLSRTLDTSRSIRGLDLSASEEAVEAMNRAHASGRLAISDTYVLLRDRDLPARDQQLSFLLTTGVRVPSPTGPVRGWLTMGLRGSDFLTRTVDDVAADQVRIALIDVDREEELVTTVATWPPGRPIVARGPVRVLDVPVAQREWQLRVYPTAALPAGEIDYLPFAVGATGLAFTALLVGLVVTLATSRDRALTAVRRATAALEADIARRERVEGRLRRSEADLRGFAGVAAHDLRAPLSSASARLELLDDEADKLSEPAREDLTRARVALRRMSSMIGDLLAYATADQSPLRRQPVDLAAMVDEIVVERTDRSDGALPRFDVGPLPTVEADPGMLRQLLDNLIGNAVKYAPRGQPAAVAITADRLPGTPAMWRIEVADRGIGVPAAQREAIFEAFRRAPDAKGYPGTGLGLAICQRIVHRHGGEIGIRDNPGGGTVFWFTLPAP